MKKERKERKKMTKKAKIITISSVIVVVFSVFLGLGIWAAPVTGKVETDHWNSNMKYTSKYAFEIEKPADRDLRILTIADTQLSDIIELTDPGDPLDEIDILVEREKPDLIIVMGDITWTALTKNSTRKFVKFMDKFGILWAPIIGNHEDEKEQGYYGNVDKNWVADRFLEAKHCLFKKGPNNIGGVGNYVINVTENGRVVESLIMMDTHSKRIYPEFDNEWGYDYIYDSQMDWYKWVLNGITEQNRVATNNPLAPTPESMLFIHIPLNEYETAYNEYEKCTDANKDEIYGFFGAKNEGVYGGKINSGMFDLITDINSTKYVFAGHDHKNNYSLMYKGVRLTYALKTGYRCSYVEGQTGGTVITIGSNNKVKIKHSYIKYEKNKPVKDYTSVIPF